MTNAELAILGLVLEKPRHGYKIEQVIEARGMREWTEIGFSSIYYLLNKLEKEGLIEGQLTPPVGRGPARKVYATTSSGAEAWRTATLDALSTASQPSSQFLLGLSGIPGLNTAEVVAALRQYQQQLRARLQQLQQRQTQSAADTPLFLAGMFTYSAALIQAELAWIADFIYELKTQK
ncbi:MAG: PadR family transcriptional regulator [Anaerolineales bacterium]|nr:PadR family transcriptional regulator [Anaerolineales bacterium]